MIGRWSAVVVGVLLTMLSVGTAHAAAAGSDPGSAVETPVLAVLDADGGSLEGRADGTYRLTLRGVDEGGTWFTDRPARHAGTASVAELVDVFFGAGDAPPNVALELTGRPEGDDVVVLEVSNPRYRAEKDRLVLDAVVIDDSEHLSGTGLTAHGGRRTSRPPKRFDAATLFLDSTSVCTASFGDPPSSGYLQALSGIDCTDAKAVVAAANDGTLPCVTSGVPPFADLGPLGIWVCQIASDSFVVFSLVRTSSSQTSESFDWGVSTSGSDPTAGYNLGPNKTA